ncbi:MAG: hypothetical protein DRG78_03970 [Epsilonproteobacteria bacterium]|nr:MAG: hypothetical protein DRG78_03970 [Campylobacterota bacterium]
MNTIYGTLIFFFYFVKYPIVIFLPIAYLKLDYPNSIVMNILAFTSVCLIIKDWFFPHDKSENCTGTKNKQKKA